MTQKDRVRNNMEALYGFDAGELALQKSEDVEIEKGRKAELIGARKFWGVREYVKTANGWKSSGDIKEAHDKIHKEKTKTVDDYKKLFAGAKSADELNKMYKEVGTETGYLPVKEMQELDEYVDDLEWKLKNPDK